MLDHLEERARPRGGGLAWHTAPQLLPDWQRELAPDGYWNLGMAHGMPGVIALLARYVVGGVDADRARRLLDGAVAYLLAAEPPRPGARYPSWHPPHRELAPKVAWCYGDLGISLALLAAAIACEHDEWRREAIQLARACASTAIADAAPRDAAICHGASGAAHLFHRLYRATGDEAFAAAALRWLEHTLAMRDDRGIGGYPARRYSDDGYGHASLLTGAVGVALVLHSMIAPVEPGWDRLLLVDV